jgi:hypothetical protein
MGAKKVVKGRRKKKKIIKMPRIEFNMKAIREIKKRKRIQRKGRESD